MKISLDSGSELCYNIKAYPLKGESENEPGDGRKKFLTKSFECDKIAKFAVRARRAPCKLNNVKNLKTPEEDESSL